MVNGQKIEIDPFKTPEIADRCKLGLANIVSDNEYIFVEEGGEQT